MDDDELAMLGGTANEPDFLPDEVIEACKTYRDAVRTSWAYRRVKKMHRCRLAEKIDRRAQHVSDYLAMDDEPYRRNLPADVLDAWASAVGNFGVQQWIACRSRLAILRKTNTRSA